MIEVFLILFCFMLWMAVKVIAFFFKISLKLAGLMLYLVFLPVIWLGALVVELLTPGRKC